MRVWHDHQVRSPEWSPRRTRLRALVLMLLFLAPLATGCLRLQASITVSPDDVVSGEIIAASKPRDDNDRGPQFDENMSFSEKVDVSSYEADGFVGSQATFSGLSFAALPQLASLSKDASGVDITLRRAGNLVILEGRVDLTTVIDPEADVRFSAVFPGEVTSTNGARVGTGAVEWQLKPGVVTTMSAQARYSDPSTRSFRTAAVWLGLAAFAVAGVIGALAWRDRDTAPRFAAADSGEDREETGATH